jgi:ABC-type glycerol-3-phosphate transport system permease component
MKRAGLTLADFLSYAALGLAVVVFLAPVLWMLITAVKPPHE